MASSANIGAFNVGNALGAWLGGVAITAGLGYTSPIWAGAGITLLGLAVMVFAAVAAKKHDAGRDAAGAVGPEELSGRVRSSSGPRRNCMSGYSRTAALAAVVVVSGRW